MKTALIILAIIVCLVVILFLYGAVRVSSEADEIANERWRINNKNDVSV